MRAEAHGDGSSALSSRLGYAAIKERRPARSLPPETQALLSQVGSASGGAIAASSATGKTTCTPWCRHWRPGSHIQHCRGRRRLSAAGGPGPAARW